MGYWLTVHWPPLRKKELPMNLYLADGRQEAGQAIRPGDLIFIYQTRTGRPRMDAKPYRLGRQGIVVLVKAETGIQECSENPETYKNGTTLWWKWQAKTSLKEYGFCPPEVVCQVLKYEPHYNFRGFGPAFPISN